MRFCNKCTKQYEDGFSFCPHCGTPDATTASSDSRGSAEAPMPEVVGPLPEHREQTPKDAGGFFGSGYLQGFIVLAVGVSIIALINSHNSDHGGSDKNTSPSSSVAAAQAYTEWERQGGRAGGEFLEHPESRVTIKKWHFAKGGFGTVLLATFTLRNDNTYSVKDINIQCDLFGKSGTKISSAEETLYDTIPANTTRTFQELNMGLIPTQTSTANCRVLKVVTQTY